MVTADCTDETCVCVTGMDADCPSAAPLPTTGDTLLAAELPVEGTVIFSLAPVITSLPTDRTIAVSDLPADLEIADLMVDRVSQADALFNDAFDENAPRLTRSKRRSSSNQNYPGELVTAEPPTSAGEEIAAAADLAPLQVEFRSPARTPESTTNRSLLQDAYVAFGVNGR